VEVCVGCSEEGLLTTSQELVDWGSGNLCWLEMLEEWRCGLQTHQVDYQLYLQMVLPAWLNRSRTDLG